MIAEKIDGKNWNPQESYERINETINGWADWKKEAYNNMFAISAHAKKVEIKKIDENT